MQKFFSFDHKMMAFAGVKIYLKKQYLASVSDLFPTNKASQLS
jgi:hypothetical protein